ncbi:MAG: hypothetical protein Q7S75_03095 [bacterium]|nr:hypothetical protein [bacterium]
MISWQRVKGVVIRGARRTSNIDGNSPYGRGTLELQFPLFRELGLDLSGCFMGTLDIRINPRTWVMVPTEPTFHGIKWFAGKEEDFFFSKCWLTFAGKTYLAWLYCASPGKPHYIRGPSLFEVIAEKIPNIGYGDTVMLEINPEDIRINDPTT